MDINFIGFLSQYMMLMHKGQFSNVLFENRVVYWLIGFRVRNHIHCLAKLSFFNSYD
jgi:hypothetical protein